MLLVETSNEAQPPLSCKFENNFAAPFSLCYVTVDQCLNFSFRQCYISFKILIRKWRVGQDHGNSTQPWHDFTSIKAKPFWPPTDSKFRAAAPLRLLLRPWR